MDSISKEYGLDQAVSPAQSKPVVSVRGRHLLAASLVNLDPRRHAAACHA